MVKKFCEWMMYKEESESPYPQAAQPEIAQPNPQTMTNQQMGNQAGEQQVGQKPNVGIFAMFNTILQTLSKKEKEGQMPFGTLWSDMESMTKRLGLTPEQVQFMHKHGLLTRMQNGWQIDKP